MRDRTAALARRIHGDLRPGEEVLAAVGLARHGTAAVALAAGARAADGVAVFGGLPELSEEPKEITGTHFLLSVTSQRILLHRRSLFGRPKEIVLATELDDGVDIRISKQGHAVFLVSRDGAELRLETPKAFRFLPDVYERLPETIAAARRDRATA